MQYFKWVWDKILAILLGILINRFTPANIATTIYYALALIVFLLVSWIIFSKRPKYLGIKMAYAATGIVFNENYDKVLLSYHKNQNMWVPPGGHVFSYELLHETVTELIKDESGVEVEFFPFHVSKVYDNICTVVPQPFRVQIEQQNTNEGHEKHYDFLYIFKAKSANTDTLTNGKLTTKWVDVNKIDDMASRRETYKDVADIVNAALDIVNKVP